MKTFIALFFLLILSGCLPSVYELPDIQAREAVIQTKSAPPTTYYIIGSDAENIFVNDPGARASADTIRTDPNGETSTSASKLAIPKSDLITIKDLRGQDITREYLSPDVANASDRALLRIADVQTKFYNAWLILTILNAGAVIALALR